MRLVRDDPATREVLGNTPVDTRSLRRSLGAKTAIGKVTMKEEALKIVLVRESSLAKVQAIEETLWKNSGKQETLMKVLLIEKSQMRVPVREKSPKEEETLVRTDGK